MISTTQGAPTSQQLKGLREERGEKLKKMNDLINQAENQKRNFNKEENDKYNTLKEEVDGLSERIARLDEKQKRELAEAAAGGATPISQVDEEGVSERSFTIWKKKPEDRTKPVQDFVQRNYEVNDKLRGANVYKVLAALATGKPQDAATERALVESRSVTGTALLNPYLGAQLWDGGLSKSHLATLGMRIMPLESNEHKIAKITTHPTFEWTAESAATTAKSAVFSQETFASKTLRGFVTSPGELLQDAQNIDSALKSVFDKSVGNSIDTAGLFGSGSGANPEGIFNYTNVNVYEMGTNGAALDSYDAYLEATKLILDDNGNVPTGAIMNPRTWLAQNKLKDLQDQPLQLPKALQNMAFYESSKVPVNQTQGSANNASCIILGGFDSLYLGVRLDVQVMVSPVKSSTYEYDFLVVFRGDFKPEREENFAVIKGIIP